MLFQRFFEELGGRGQIKFNLSILDISVPHEDILVCSTLMALRFVRVYVVYTILLRNMYAYLSTVLSNTDKA